MKNIALIHLVSLCAGLCTAAPYAPRFGAREIMIEQRGQHQTHRDLQGRDVGADPAYTPPDTREQIDVFEREIQIEQRGGPYDARDGEIKVSFRRDAAAGGFGQDYGRSTREGRATAIERKGTRVTRTEEQERGIRVNSADPLGTRVTRGEEQERGIRVNGREDDSWEP